MAEQRKSCPMDAVLDNAVARCPFLARLAVLEGDSFAKAIALRPCAPAAVTASSPRRPVLEELEDYTSSFRMWHGSEGVIPLARTAAADTSLAQQQAVPTRVLASVPAEKQQLPRQGATPRPLPLATMSLSFGSGMPDFGRMLRALQQQHHKHLSNNSSSKARPKPKPSSGPNSHTTSSSNTASRGAVQPAANSGGTCPMRKMLGPLAPLVFNAKGHIQCPEPIIRARAALAATKPVRELRPQALPIKLAAVGAVTAGVNVPCGMVREHTEKFSFGWFVAVHASIPFIAMLRKAVIMPKYAIIYTIATAVAGQAMGAKLERKRLLQANPQQTHITTSKLRNPAVLSAALSVEHPNDVQSTLENFSMGRSKLKRASTGHMIVRKGSAAAPRHAKNHSMASHQLQLMGSNTIVSLDTLDSNSVPLMTDMAALLPSDMQQHTLIRVR